MADLHKFWLDSRVNIDQLHSEARIEASASGKGLDIYEFFDILTARLIAETRDVEKLEQIFQIYMLPQPEHSVCRTSRHFFYRTALGLQRTSDNQRIPHIDIEYRYRNRTCDGISYKETAKFVEFLKPEFDVVVRLFEHGLVDTKKRVMEVPYALTFAQVYTTMALTPSRTLCHLYEDHLVGMNSM